MMAGLYQVGLAGYLGEFFRSAQYYKGLESFALGPGITTGLGVASDIITKTDDFIREPVDTFKKSTVGGFSFPLGPTFKNYGGK